MPESERIPVALLLLDARNARLRDEQPSQQQVYYALAKQQGRRLVRLAEDIVRYGLDPLTSVAVAPTADQKRRYLVIEGNRRVLAVKALETPTIVSGALAQSDYRKLVSLSSRFAENPIDEIDCVIFATEDDARHWVELRHTGANEGAGIVEWGPDEKDRYLARHGTRGRAGQVLDFVERSTGTSTQARISTNIDRLIKSPYVRRRLGLDLAKGQVLSRYPAPQVAKGLRRIVDDLASERIRVKDIYYADDIVRYIDAIPPEHLPSGKPLSTPVPLDSLPVRGATTPTRSASSTSRSRTPAARVTLIPRTCAANPTLPRINAIYNELLRMNVDDYPNACAVLLRVFLELSIDHYLASHQLMSEPDRRSARLAKRLKVVAEDLHKRGRVDEQLRKALNRIADSPGVLAASTTTFNQYVHNQYVYPKPTELRTAWDELQPFMEKLWP